MLARVAILLRAWDEASRRPGWRWGGFLVGLAVFCAVLAVPTPVGLNPEAQRVGAVGVVMAMWWVGNVFPMALTAVVPFVAFPLLGVASPRDVAVSYAHPLNALMAGGFILAVGIERAGLHERLTAVVLAFRAVRASPDRVLLALMGCTALLSGMVSNTATTVMMLPLATALAARASDDPRARSAFVLALAYSASIGGVSTLVGTPPNAVFAGLAADMGTDVGFATWLALGVPFVVGALPVAHWVVTRVAIPIQPRANGLITAPPVPSWRHGERAVLAIVAGALAGWLTRKPLDLGAIRIPGWSEGMDYGGVELDAVVAVAAGAAVFFVPGGRGDTGERRLLVRWKDVEQGVPWSVLILLGGGFALAAAIRDSGLTAWLASGADGLASVHEGAAALGIALGMTFVTEITSNTASTQIALPLLAGAAERAGVEPLLWMVPATMAASCAFMLPVATAPNAIAAEAGGVSPTDMATAGFVLNLLLVPWVALVAFVGVRWLL